MALIDHIKLGCHFRQLQRRAFKALDILDGDISDALLFQEGRIAIQQELPLFQLAENLRIEICVNLPQLRQLRIDGRDLRALLSDSRSVRNDDRADRADLRLKPFLANAFIRQLHPQNGEISALVGKKGIDGREHLNRRGDPRLPPHQGLFAFDLGNLLPHLLLAAVDRLPLHFKIPRAIGHILLEEDVCIRIDLSNRALPGSGLRLESKDVVRFPRLRHLHIHRETLLLGQRHRNDLSNLALERPPVKNAHQLLIVHAAETFNLAGGVQKLCFGGEAMDAFGRMPNQKRQGRKVGYDKRQQNEPLPFRKNTQRHFLQSVKAPNLFGFGLY